MLGVTDDRERLRGMFDLAAETYQDARPDYPGLLFDRLLEITGCRAGDRVLEVGAGPGKATLPLLQRGLHVTAVEPGPAMSAQLRQNLRGYPAEVVPTRFEDWAGPWGRYTAVIAATAWHWVDPVRRYRLAADVLRPGGHLAIWSGGHVCPPGGDLFFEEIQEVYHAIGEGDPQGARRPEDGQLPDQVAEIEASGLFEMITVEHVRHRRSRSCRRRPARAPPEDLVVRRRQVRRWPLSPP